MASVTLVSPRGDLTRDVNDLDGLNAYIINRGWSPQSGTYADAYLAVTGQPYKPTPPGSSSSSQDVTLAARVVRGGARTDLVQSAPGQLPGSVLSGLNFCCADPTTASDVYGQKVGNSLRLAKAAFGAGTVTDLYLFGAGDGISGILVLPGTGTILVTTADVTSVSAPSTVKRIWRSTDHGVTFTKVADLTPGAYLSFHGMTTRNGVTVVTDYGIHTGDAASIPGQTATRVYLSEDDGQTWRQILNADEGVSGRHLHASFIDSAGTIWVSTGDGPGNRMVWKSTNKGASWSKSTIVDTEGIEKQVLGMEEYDGWIWAAIDDPNQGGIWRWPMTGPASAAEEVLSAGDTYTLPGLLNSSGWQAPGYSIRRDPKFGAWYAYFPGETAGKRGRFLASGDGLTWQTLFETGDSGVSPGTARFEFDAAFAYYNNWRWPLLKPYVHRGWADTEIVPLTFTWPGALASKTGWVTIRPDHLGFDFRVLRVAISVSAAGTAAIFVLPKNGGSVLTTGGSGAPTINANATGAGLQSVWAMSPTPLQRFTALRSDTLTLDVTATGGGTDLTVVVLVEKYATPPKAYMSATQS